MFYEFKILDDGSIKCNMSQPAHNMNEEGIKKYNKISRYYTGLFLLNYVNLVGFYSIITILGKKTKLT